MSWSPRKTDLIKKQPTELGKLLGSKPGMWNSQQPNKGQTQNDGRNRGGGKRATKSEGWYCKHCDFYNFGYRA
eukprot:3597328-Amphidinium_carterae.1